MRKLLSIALLLYALPISVAAQQFSYSEAKGAFTIDFIAPPPNAASDDNPPRWRYFLETGDGHYYMDTLSVVSNKATTIPHRYQQRGTYRVSLFLSPMYALASTKEKITREITIGSPRAGNGPEYDRKNGSVMIISNATGEAIANHKMRFALHHDRYSGAGEQGYLVFFYNHIDDSDFLGFDPFIDLEEDGLYYKQSGYDKLKRLEGPLLDVQSGINSTGNFLFKKISEDYNDAIAFRSELMGDKESRRAFFSLQVDKKIDYKRQKNYKLQLAALWIPDNGD